MAQNGQKWATGGNTLSGGEVLGSTNNFPLNFIVNSQQELAILTNGNIQVASLNNGNTGLVTYSSNGTLVPLNFTGNAAQVLSGNGTWVAGNSFSQWITNGSNIYYNSGYVGIGLPNPTAPLTVSGNIVSTGNIYGNTLAAANSVQVGTVKITSTGNVDTLRSTSSLQVNATTINAGTVNANNMTITNNFSADTITAPVVTSSRVRPMKGDSLIRFGDSTFYLDQNNYNIFSGTNPLCVNPNCPPTKYFGIALGYPNIVSGSAPFSTPSIAAGTNNNVNNGFAIGGGNNINNGFAIGYSNNVNSGGLLVIGAGLTNNIAGSIMIGNSIKNKPAITIIPDVSGNTAGKVGIGTTAPQAQLDIENAGQTEVHVYATTNANSRIWSINSSYAYALGTDANGSGGIYGNFNAPVEIMTFSNTGQIGIGMTPSYPLDVAGVIRAQDVKVCLSGCDFVFDKDYKLMPLKKLKEYLQLNHHLPGIASAKEMESSDGVALGKMNSQLLQTAEEHSLYIIQLQDEITQQQKEIDELKKEITESKK